MKEGYEKNWETAMGRVSAEMKAWRDAHPTATFREIEEALEGRLAQLRADMLKALASASEATEGRDEAGERVACPQCGAPSYRHGYRTRKLKGQHDAEVELTRRYLTCPGCGHTFFPSGQ